LRRIIHRIIADYPDAEIREAEVLLPKDKSTRTRKS
jgi:hypothetical protein